MQLFFVNTGYGECQILKSKSNNVTVIDGGPSDRETYKEVGTLRVNEALKLLNIDHINNLICTHIHYDHIAGLCEISKDDEIKIDNFYINALLPHNISNLERPSCGLLNFEDFRLWKYSLKAYRNLISDLKRKNTHIREVLEKETLFLDEDASLEIFGLTEDSKKERLLNLEALNTNDDHEFIKALKILNQKENQKSLFFILNTKNYRALLTGDRQNFDDVKDRLPICDLLKVTHHGQKDGLPDLLLDKCHPHIFVICADLGKKYQSACDFIFEKCRDFCKKDQKEAKILVTGNLPSFDKKTPAILGFDDNLQIFYPIYADHVLDDKDIVLDKIFIENKNTISNEDNYDYDFEIVSLKSGEIFCKNFKVLGLTKSFSIKNLKKSPLKIFIRNFNNYLELSLFIKDIKDCIVASDLLFFKEELFKKS